MSYQQEQKSNTLPNFIIGGTSAAGTSFLSSAMMQHPDIYLPKDMRPEPHFFYKSWEHEKGTEYYSERWFSKVANQKAIGERSSSYIFGAEDTASRMHTLIPELKLIFTLRNPVQRAWANYRYTALQGLEDVDFDMALKLETDRIRAQTGIWAEIQPHNYTGRGFYGQQLLAFLKYYPREQILLLESEAMNENPQLAFETVFEFLGVSKDFKPELPPLFTSLNVHDALLQKQLRAYFKDKFDLLIEAIRKEDNPFSLVNADEKSFLEQLIGNLKGEKANMSKWANDYLVDLYREDVQLLRTHFNFVPRHWDISS